MQSVDYKRVYVARKARLSLEKRTSPEWVFKDDDGSINLVEVKGSHRFPSEGRALTAWKEARAAFTFFRFVWAVKRKEYKKVFCA